MLPICHHLSKSVEIESISIFSKEQNVPIQGVSMEVSGLKCPHYYVWV